MHVMRFIALCVALYAGHSPRAHHWHMSNASEYGKGDGQMGGPLACGGTLEPNTIEVANKTLPCGTKVTFKANGVKVRARVRDRGPYAGDREWDLSYALARKLRLIYPWSGAIKWHLGW